MTDQNQKIVEALEQIAGVLLSVQSHAVQVARMEEQLSHISRTVDDMRSCIKDVEAIKRDVALVTKDVEGVDRRQEDDMGRSDLRLTREVLALEVKIDKIFKNRVEQYKTRGAVMIALISGAVTLGIMLLERLL